MAVRRFTPEGMLQPTPYEHVAVGTGTRHVHVSGQVARTVAIRDGRTSSEGRRSGVGPGDAHVEGTAEEYAVKVEQISLTFSARVGEEGKLFGSVTSADIAQQLEAQGFAIEKRQIDLHEPIKALGVYRVPIKLHADVKPEIKVWVIKQ